MNIYKVIVANQTTQEIFERNMRAMTKEKAEQTFIKKLFQLDAITDCTFSVTSTFVKKFVKNSESIDNSFMA